MTMTDSLGHPLTGATREGADAFEQACAELRRYVDDPLASVDRAIAACPGMPMAHALRAWLHLLATEPAGLPVARACLETAEALPGNRRERGHLAAIRLLTQGRWREAGRVLEDVSAEHPRDALALQAGHLIDFYTGDARMLRDRIARALPAWTPAMPGHHALLGMYAFGLEECGDYDAAERFGRASVEREPRDGWSWHAVAHVMEMRNRTADGVAWLADHADAWAPGSFFGIHLWWHLAVFHLDRGDEAAVLRLYDERIRATRSGLALDLIDASALLWRLALRGVDLGDRWEDIADRWAPLVGDDRYAFNGWHAMMAFIGSGRPQAQGAVIESLRRTADGTDDDASFAKEVGLDAVLGFQAFGAGRHDEAVALLRRIRSSAHRFGGSHAQRDLIDLTLIEAAFRGGNVPLARALAAERSARRPESPVSRAFMVRAGLAGADALGRGSEATAAVGR